MAGVPKAISQGSIGYQEAVSVVVIVLITKGFLTYPSIIEEIGGSASWLVVLLSAGVATLAFLLTVALLNRFPGKAIAEVAEAAGGPVIGVLFSTVVAGLIILEVSLSLREFGENMISTALPETPPSAIMFVFAVGIVYGAYAGLEALARSSRIALTYILGALLLIILLSYNQWNFHWLYPVLGTGLNRILPAALYRSGDYWEMIAIALFVPAFQATQSIRRIGLVSILITAIVFMAIMLADTIVFSPKVAQESYLTMYLLARAITIGRFVQRIESVFVFVWALGGFLRMALGLYAVATTLAYTLQLPDYRPFILPVAVVIFTLAFIPHDLPTTVVWANNIFRPAISLFIFAAPLSLLILAKVRGKGGSANVQS